MTNMVLVAEHVSQFCWPSGKADITLQGISNFESRASTAVLPHFYFCQSVELVRYIPGVYDWIFFFKALDAIQNLGICWTKGRFRRFLASISIAF